MDLLTKEDFSMLFSNLCCSKCKNDFSIESVEVIEQQNDILICRLICRKCGADFGNIILKYCKNIKVHSPFEVIEGPPSITFDDVIDAHEFITKKL